MSGTDQQVVPALSTDAVPGMPGVRAGAVVLVGIVAVNLGNYGFHLLSARVLGPARYGDVASLVALAGLVSLPLAGIQVHVARTVARQTVTAGDESIAAFARHTVAVASALGLALAILLVAATPLLTGLLNIDSSLAVALTAALAAPAVVTPVLWGLAQGLQRFWTLTVAMSLTPFVRLAAAAVLFVAGLRVVGAMAATLVATFVGVLVPAWPLRRWFRRIHAPVEQRPVRSTLADAGPVVLGLLALTSLTTVDVVVAKALFDDHDAGIYGSASLAGRVILYLPAAIVMVLLPKVSARVAAGRDAAAILHASIGATLAFCLAATLVYTAVPKLVARVAFGGGFEEVSELLPLFAVAMTIYALLNVLLTYHLGHGSSSMSFLLVAGAVLQLVGFALFHDTPRELLLVTGVTATALVVVHEVLFEAVLLDSARALIDRLRVRRMGLP